MKKEEESKAELDKQLEKENKEKANKASRSGKVFCLIIVFLLIYGRMLLSTFSADSGFTRKKSANITDTTIVGEIDGRYFEEKILNEAKEIL